MCYSEFIWSNFASTSSFTIASAAFADLSWTQLPSPITQHQSFTAEVTAVDAYGNVKTNFRATQH